MKRRLAVAVFLAACAVETTAPRRAATITASEAFSPREGEQWVFVNSYGDTTTITNEAVPTGTACRGGRNIVWHYRKTNARAYWNPGVDGAEIRFVLHQNADSSWRSTASAISFPHSCPWCNGTKSFTWDILDNPAAEPPGYQIVPPTLHRGDTITFDTKVDAVGGPDLFTLNCVVPDGQLTALEGHGEQWKTMFYIEDVSTPIYSGAASVSEQWENCNEAHDDRGCGHQKWWFAPGLGLVKVWQINSGSGVEGDADTKIIMRRIRT